MQEKAEKDKLRRLMGKPVQKEKNSPKPSVAKTEKSLSPSLPQSSQRSPQRGLLYSGETFCREELRKIRRAAKSGKEQEAEIGTSALDKSGDSDRAKRANRKTEHKQPQRKKKKPKSKETR